MSIKIIYKNLKLISYEANGNIIPILDIGNILDIKKYDPFVIRKFLETNKDFRLWLKREGRKLNADSIMIYYSCSHENYDYVTFVGEPNTSIYSPFSEMCGNGIRCLSLHIGLNKNMKNGEKLRIWSGSVKEIIFKKINRINYSGEIEVNINAFQYKRAKLKMFLNLEYFSNIDNFSDIFLPNVPNFLNKYKFGIGYNGNDIGEPHLVLLMTKNEYINFSKKYLFKNKDFMQNIRVITSTIGRIVTFDKNLFSLGINFSFGVLSNGKIYMSTHERNILHSNKICRNQQKINSICRCNTLSCGTGGAVVANIAFLQNLIGTQNITTIHPGGQIKYFIEKDTTIMLGTVKKM